MSLIRNEVWKFDPVTGEVTTTNPAASHPRPTPEGRFIVAESVRPDHGRLLESVPMLCDLSERLAHAVQHWLPKPPPADVRLAEQITELLSLVGAHRNVVAFGSRTPVTIHAAANAINALIDSVAVMSAIADNYEASEGSSPDPSGLNLYISRDGRRVLTLADCLKAREALRALGGAA